MKRCFLPLTVILLITMNITDNCKAEILPAEPESNQFVTIDSDIVALKLYEGLSKIENAYDNYQSQQLTFPLLNCFSCKKKVIDLIFFCKNLNLTSFFAVMLASNTMKAKILKEMFSIYVQCAEKINTKDNDAILEYFNSVAQLISLDCYECTTNFFIKPYYKKYDLTVAPGCAFDDKCK